MQSNSPSTEDPKEERIQLPIATPEEDGNDSILHSVKVPEKEFKRGSIKKASFSNKNLQNKCYNIMRKLAQEKRNGVIQKKRGIEVEEDPPTNLITNCQSSTQPPIPSNPKLNAMVKTYK